MGNIDSHPEVVSHKEESDRPRKRRRLLIWIIVGLVGFLVLAIALGVGLGVGLTRHKNSKSSSRCGSFRATSAGDWNHLLTLSISASTASSSTSNTSLPHGIFNDSSVTIVALGDGDRRLLFQEGTGSIREALFTQSANSWRTDINNIVATDARNNTPLAALLVNSTGTPFAEDTGPVVRLQHLNNEQDMS